MEYILGGLACGCSIQLFCQLCFFHMMQILQRLPQVPAFLCFMKILLPASNLLFYYGWASGFFLKMASLDIVRLGVV